MKDQNLGASEAEKQRQVIGIGRMDQNSSADLDIDSLVVDLDKEVGPSLAVSIRILAGNHCTFAADEAHDGGEDTVMEEVDDWAWLEDGLVVVAGTGKGTVGDSEVRQEEDSH
jgi:hypothetical protein